MNSVTRNPNECANCGTLIAVSHGEPAQCSRCAKKQLEALIYLNPSAKAPKVVATERNDSSLPSFKSLITTIHPGDVVNSVALIAQEASRKAEQILRVKREAEAKAEAKRREAEKLARNTAKLEAERLEETNRLEAMKRLDEERMKLETAKATRGNSARMCRACSEIFVPVMAHFQVCPACHAEFTAKAEKKARAINSDPTVDELVALYLANRPLPRGWRAEMRAGAVIFMNGRDRKITVNHVMRAYMPMAPIAVTTTRDQRQVPQV